MVGGLFGGVRVSIFSVAFLLDRATKLLALRYFASCVYLNHGISFSLFKNSPWVGLFMSLLGILMLSFLSVRNKKFRRNAGVPLLLAGAIGNLVDRFFYGYVVDWFYVGIHMNLADVWLCLGVLVFIANLQPRSV